MRRVRQQSGELLSRRTRKHGGPKRRVWRKIHLGIDETTREIRAVEFTTSDLGHAPLWPERLTQIPPDQEIGRVTTEGAHTTRKGPDAAAVIPPRQNAKPWRADTAGAIARKEALRTSRRLGRATWRPWSGPHRRSRAETKRHGVTLLGQRLSARDFDRPGAALQTPVAILHGYTALRPPHSSPGVRRSGTRGRPSISNSRNRAGLVPLL